MKKYVSIFGSYRCTPDNEEYNVAFSTAYQLSKAGYTIINGGGKGIMEASSLGAKDAGGKSIGVILSNLQNEKIKTRMNDNIIICNSLFERLQKLIENSAGFIIFSGGTGTLVELSLAWELMNKGLLKILPIICYGDFWKPVVNNLKDEPSYIKGFCTDFIQFAYSVEEILGIFA
ncbi:MAG: LOG family protein [Spirochaetes bacterium]|nr:LOG family protein [Spirochaetota bacterium]